MSEIKRKMSGNDLSLIIRYLVMIAVGVLFCLSPAFGKSALSTILGIGFIVTGAVFLIISLAVEKSLISGSAFIGYFAIALGILAIAANVMSLVFDYVPYFYNHRRFGYCFRRDFRSYLKKRKKRCSSCHKTSCLRRYACFGNMPFNRRLF